MSTPSCFFALGNPGSTYLLTRHNAGRWWLNRLSDHPLVHSLHANQQKKCYERQVQIEDKRFLLLEANVYMNESGLGLQRYLQQKNSELADICVVHDDIDLDPGTVRIKWDGGHGGHNGLRDIAKHLGANHWRVRIGVGHPGDANLVSDYVLSKPNTSDYQIIMASIDHSIDMLLTNLDNWPRWQQLCATKS